MIPVFFKILHSKKMLQKKKIPLCEKEPILFHYTTILNYAKKEFQNRALG